VLGSRYPLRALETGSNAPHRWQHSTSAEAPWLHRQQIRVSGSRFFIHGGSGGSRTDRDSRYPGASLFELTATES